ncbi:GNAT family N-acetyltransferase [Roseibium polysiphoniae]|uniref:GNAT family N-acetyltransferase n=1 Tax=Roseibium polysiphoniae TaxID=2571221 RepID=A0ABR9CBS0_9HYPH|nr:GNAT family N-acetyltransferase [Roseibium polysiphoniae]MBD8876352.1 GNAT family N-acetyltransferase [Roseibium polysiphoniae]
MSKDYDIRQAQAADEAAVRACAEDAYEQYVEAIGKKPAPMVADFASLITAGCVHVAVEGPADVIGFIIFFREGDHVLLENVAVRSDATGRGIGKSLIALCERTAKSSGAGSVKLYTNEKMSANLTIYPRLGYRETDRKTEDGFHRVYFEKRI